jgi:hypothetical protein
MGISRTFKPWIAVLGLTVVFVACSSSSHAGAPATTATTGVPATTATTAQSSTTARGSTTQASTSTSSVPSGPPACPTSQLAVTLGQGDGAAGSVYFPLNFRNQGTTTCTLNGYPGVSYVTGSSGTQVGSPATRVAVNGSATTPQVVVLAPGKSASAALREVNVANYPAATCTPTPVLGLRVYPPNQTAAAFVSQTSNGCAQTGPEQLQISFVVAGGG